MENFGAQLLLTVRSRLPEVNERKRVRYLGYIQAVAAAGSLLLLILFGVALHAFGTAVCIHSGIKANSRVALFASCHGYNIAINWKNYTFVMIAICLQCWASTRLMDSTRMNISIAARRRLAIIWTQVTVVLMTLEFATFVTYRDQEILRYYVAPVTFIRVWLLCVINTYINNLNISQPFGAKRLVPSMYKHLQKVISHIIFLGVLLTFVCYFLYNVLAPIVNTHAQVMKLIDLLRKRD